MRVDYRTLYYNGLGVLVDITRDIRTSGDRIEVRITFLLLFAKLKVELSWTVGKE